MAQRSTKMSIRILDSEFKLTIIIQVLKNIHMFLLEQVKYILNKVRIIQVSINSGILK